MQKSNMKEDGRRKGHNLFENKEVDIGKISTPLGDVDLLPDAIEKHLLTQTVLLSIAVVENILQSSYMNLFDKSISIKLKDL